MGRGEATYAAVPVEGNVIALVVWDGVKVGLAIHADSYSVNSLG